MPARVSMLQPLGRIPNVGFYSNGAKAPVFSAKRLSLMRDCTHTVPPAVSSSALVGLTPWAHPSGLCIESPPQRSPPRFPICISPWLQSAAAAFRGFTRNTLHSLYSDIYFCDSWENVYLCSWDRSSRGPVPHLLCSQHGA